MPKEKLYGVFGFIVRFLFAALVQTSVVASSLLEY